MPTATVTTKLDTRDPDEGAHTYAVLVDGVRVGTVTAPARGLGERDWTARADGRPGVARYVRETTRRAAAERLAVAVRS